MALARVSRGKSGDKSSNGGDTSEPSAFAIKDSFGENNCSGCIKPSHTTGPVLACTCYRIPSHSSQVLIWKAGISNAAAILAKSGHEMPEARSVPT